ncbi:hypothetical protein ACH9EU_04275 [Kocuria sp. M1R5S2]|uniref:hypothetical protein n=1 Tax=Kocuria rhizosphaerae TaxID=3376285 RepID=UPI0037BB8A4D
MSDAQLPMWLEVLRALGTGLGPVLLFVSAVIAAVIAWKTYKQREEADRQHKEADERAEWWRRTQWAIDHASAEDEEKAIIGVEALTLLSKSPLAADEDRVMLETLFEEIIAARTARPYNEKSAPDAPRQCPRWRFPRARRGE